MNSNTNPKGVTEGLFPAISAVSTNPITPQSNYSVISSEQLEEINKGLVAWKQQEINIKTQEALLAQLKFFYAARMTVLFMFPIVVAIVLFITLYVLNNENVMDYKLFRGLTIFVGLAAVVEIILYPAKEKKLELQLKNLSLTLEGQNKEINILKQQIETLEKTYSEQKDKLDKLSQAQSLRQCNVGGAKKSAASKRKK
jgi:hypothetical protein